jgi:hypothetical protein
MIVPIFIMMVPAFKVLDNRASPYVEDLAVHEKKEKEKASSCDEASVVFALI